MKRGRLCRRQTKRHLRRRSVSRSCNFVMSTTITPPGDGFVVRADGVYPHDLAAWRQSVTQTLAQPEEARASPQQTKQDRRRIKELERELHRKDRALAETAALLVLSKKVAAIFNTGEDA